MFVVFGFGATSVALPPSNLSMDASHVMGYVKLPIVKAKNSSRATVPAVPPTLTLNDALAEFKVLVFILYGCNANVFLGVIDTA